MPRKVMHYDWIYQTLREGLWQTIEPSERQLRIIAAVRRELDGLTEFEREFVELFWFEGRSIAAISTLTGKPVYKLEGLCKRIIRKLKNRLSGFVESEFGLKHSVGSQCLICKHPRRDEIDRMILAKKPHQTYSSIIKTLKQDYGIIIKTPQIIIGHKKYHIREDS